MSNLFDGIKDLAKNAADKTNEVIELGKHKARIAQEENTINGIKEQIGNYYWEHYVSGKQLDGPVMNWCKEIEKSQAVIGEIQAQIKEMKKEAPEAAYTTITKCRACGYENQPDTKFCGNCGVKL